MREQNKLSYYMDLSERLKKQNADLVAENKALQKINKSLEAMADEKVRHTAQYEKKIEDCVSRYEEAIFELTEAKMAYENAKKELTRLNSDFQRRYREFMKTIK